MAAIKKVPAIRFNGFEEEWEEKELGDIGSVAMNKRIFKNQTEEKGEIPFYKIGTFGGDPDAFISKSIFENYKSKYPYPTKGDILISASGSIGKTVEYLGADEYFQDSNIVWLKHDGKAVLNEYLKYFYSIVKWDGLEGSTIKRLYNSNILQTRISLSPLPEQTQIGNYFKELDALILLQEQKLQKVINLKKAMLEKMFPKEGADVPEIRFREFTKKWEKNLLGQIADFLKGKGYTKNDLRESGQPIILYGRLYTRYQTVINDVDTFAEEKKEAVFSKGNEVIVPASGETSVDISRASAVLKRGVILGGDLNVIYANPQLNPVFLALCLTHGKSKNELSKSIILPKYWTAD